MLHSYIPAVFAAAKISVYFHLIKAKSIDCG